MLNQHLRNLNPNDAHLKNCGFPFNPLIGLFLKDTVLKDNAIFVCDMVYGVIIIITILKPPHTLFLRNDTYFAPFKNLLAYIEPTVQLYGYFFQTEEIFFNAMICLLKNSFIEKIKAKHFLKKVKHNYL